MTKKWGTKEIENKQKDINEQLPDVMDNNGLNVILDKLVDMYEREYEAVILSEVVISGNNSPWEDEKEGLPSLLKTSKKLELRDKDILEDSGNILLIYHSWQQQLAPQMDFDYFIEKIEKNYVETKRGENFANNDDNGDNNDKNKVERNNDTGNNINIENYIDDDDGGMDKKDVENNNGKNKNKIKYRYTNKNKEDNGDNNDKNKVERNNDIGNNMNTEIYIDDDGKSSDEKNNSKERNNYEEIDEEIDEGIDEEYRDSLWDNAFILAIVVAIDAKPNSQPIGQSIKNW
ncbi:9061_t:CDS:2 [Entrophospora sp. SA101]|nr:9061_t:CDS:2 [Entrophospora sp. SA101]CAJ0899519.1 4533_t:CDS:2 [Entrophospora sp. SA101]